MAPPAVPAGDRAHRCRRSTLIELGQLAVATAYGFPVRVADVDDVLLNTSGVLVGYLLWRASSSAASVDSDHAVRRSADRGRARPRARGPDGWTREGDAIRRTVACADFRGAIALVNAVADAAEAANHHPDIHITGTGG